MKGEFGNQVLIDAHISVSVADNKGGIVPELQCGSATQENRKTDRQTAMCSQFDTLRSSSTSSVLDIYKLILDHAFSFSCLQHPL